MFTEKLNESLSIQGVLVSTNHTNNTDNTITAIDASKFKRMLGLLEIGAIASGGTNVQAQWYGCNTSGGTYTAITGAIVTLNTANTCGSVEVRSDQLPAGNRYVQLTVTVNGTNSIFCSAWALGGEAGYKPASNADANNTNGVQVGGPTRVTT